MKGHGKAKEGGWPPKDKVGASLLKSLNSSSYLRGVSTPNYHFFPAEIAYVEAPTIPESFRPTLGRDRSSVYPQYRTGTTWNAT